MFKNSFSSRFSKFARSGNPAETTGQDQNKLDLKNLQQIGKQFSRAMIFAPGVFFVLIAFTAILAPTLLLGIFAGLFLFLGIACSMLAWKFIQLKKKFDAIARKFEGKVLVQGVNLGNIVEVQQDFEEPVDHKKIILH